MQQDQVAWDQKAPNMELDGMSSGKGSIDGRTLNNVPLCDDEGKLDRLSTMPVWFVAFYEQYIRQHTEVMDALQRETRDAKMLDEEKGHFTISEYAVDERDETVDPAVLRKMSANITMLEGGILFHSVFVGMTVSITTERFVILLVAISFHQLFEGLGLGSRIAAVPYPKTSVRPWVLVLAFGTTAPIGQAIGLLTRNTYDPEGAFGLILVGVFNAM
jgi:zinc transporter ZupT